MYALAKQFSSFDRAPALPNTRGRKVWVTWSLGSRARGTDARYGCAGSGWFGLHVSNRCIFEEMEVRRDVVLECESQRTNMTMRRENTAISLAAGIYSASTAAAGVVSCWFRARMLGRRELWLLPAQDDMSCCGGLGARSISVAKRVEQVSPLQRRNTHRARRRQSRARRTSAIIAVMSKVMKCKSPIAFGFTECSGRPSSASSWSSSSTENALVPCSLSSGLSSIRDFSGPLNISIVLPPAVHELLRDYCTHSAP
jgi:hypothetical protein